jgi:hypothetical protein
MAHTFTFENMDYFILSKDEIMDIVELFYRWGDAQFKFADGKCDKSTYLGQHVCRWDGQHQITLSKAVIQKCFEEKKRIGGNNTIAPTLKMAAAQVIVHELMHANQEKLHKGEKGFYGIKNGHTQTGKPKMKRYWGRACEREAREYVDVKFNEILAYFNLPSQKGPKVGNGVAKGSVGAEVSAVIALFLECSEVSADDIRQELRLSHILNPGNFKAVADELKKNGFAQTKDVFLR